MKRASDRKSKAEKVSGAMSKRLKTKKCGVCGQPGNYIEPDVIRCVSCTAAREGYNTDTAPTGSRIAAKPRLEDYDRRTK